jgi:hypothetical protein
MIRAHYFNSRRSRRLMQLYTLNLSVYIAFICIHCIYLYTLHVSVYITFMFEYSNSILLSFFFFRHSRRWWKHAAPASTPHTFDSNSILLSFLFFRRSRRWWKHAAPASTPHTFAFLGTTSSPISCVGATPRAPTSSTTPPADIFKSEFEVILFFLRVLIFSVFHQLPNDG